MKAIDYRSDTRKRLDAAIDKPITWKAAELGISVDDYCLRLYQEFPTIVFPEWEADFIGYCTL